MKTAFTGTRAGTPESSFRLFLQSELARRCTRNRMYSLRAFAHQLGVDASTLSQWLRNKRPLTARTIETLGAQLGLPPQRIATYVDQATRPSVGDDDAFFELTRDTAELIGDWYHFAILELVRLEHFQPDTRWIARMLDVTVDEVNIALHRLIRLDLLDMRSPTEWVDKTGDAAITVDALGVAAVERLQRHMRELSVKALGAIPMTGRDHSSTTVAINSRMLPKAFELTARFRQQLLQLLQEGPADDVYQIEVALFPVTTAKRKSIGEHDERTGD